MNIETALDRVREALRSPLPGVAAQDLLTPIDIPVSGFRLHPIVAAAAERPALHAADAEVARILEIDIDTLFDASAIAWRAMTRDGATRQVPCLAAAGVEIWGATAMVLAEFLTLLGWPGPSAK